MEQKKWSEREGWKSECVVPNRKIYSEQFCGKIEDDWSCLGFLKEEIAAELAIGSNLQIWFSISTRKRNKEKVNHRGEFYSMKGETIIFLIQGVFRCASISWIHDGESVSNSLINVFEISSSLGHISGISSTYLGYIFEHNSGIYCECLGHALCIS